jgi:hypothetical protein
MRTEKKDERKKINCETFIKKTKEGNDWDDDAWSFLTQTSRNGGNEVFRWLYEFIVWRDKCGKSLKWEMVEVWS